MHKDDSDKTNEYFFDCVNLASEIIGVKCSTTMMNGDPEKGDLEPKYQIVPDPYTINDSEKRLEFLAFEDYFYENFGKWKGRSYFDSPSQAFVGIMKAWHIWNSGSYELKKTYVKEARERYK